MNNLKSLLLVFLCSFFSFVLEANDKSHLQVQLLTAIHADTGRVDSAQQTRKNFFPKTENKKLVAAILAFPVPFGFLGLHRIYLGTDPWVPVVYLVTGGGGAMILPLIDFIAIITADPEELKSYENNPKIFMWAK